MGIIDSASSISRYNPLKISQIRPNADQDNSAPPWPNQAKSRFQFWKQPANQRARRRKMRGALVTSDSSGVPW